MSHDERLKKIRMLLMTKNDTAFFVALAYKVKATVSTDIPTACINSESVLFNPNFMDSLTDDELLFLYLHELMHLVLLHSARLGHRDPSLWNCAGDYVINLALTKKGYKMPEGGLLDEKFNQLTTEEVYKYLEENAPETECPMPDIGKEGSGNGENSEEAPQVHHSTIVTAEGVIKEILREASQIAEMSGEKPGDICPDLGRMLQEVFSSQIDWRNKLQKSVTGTLKRKMNWLRPNRRYLPNYLPRAKRYGVDTVTILIDVSGSVTAKELSTYVGETLYILRTAKPKKVEMFFFSVGISDQHIVKSLSDVKEILRRPINSRGGTSLTYALVDLEEHKSDLVVIFSDGYFAPPPRHLFKPKTKYIGCFTTDHQSNLKADLPWEIVEIKVMQ